MICRAVMMTLESNVGQGTVIRESNDGEKMGG